jgi:hypothetical protein
MLFELKLVVEEAQDPTIM